MTTWWLRWVRTACFVATAQPSLQSRLICCCVFPKTPWSLHPGFCSSSAASSLQSGAALLRHSSIKCTYSSLGTSFMWFSFFFFLKSCCIQATLARVSRAAGCSRGHVDARSGPGPFSTDPVEQSNWPTFSPLWYSSCSFNTPPLHMHQLRAARVLHMCKCVCVPGNSFCICNSSHGWFPYHADTHKHTHFHSVYGCCVYSAWPCGSRTCAHRWPSSSGCYQVICTILLLPFFFFCGFNNRLWDSRLK